MKLLFIGLGSIAKKHIRAIQAIDKTIQIYGLRHSPTSNEVESVASIFSWDEIDFIPDGILICNPTKFHEEAIIQSLKFNCPLFIEKPSLHQLGNSEHLLNLIDQNKIITYVGLDLRFHPSLIFLKTYLDRENIVLNEVNIYCGSYLPDWRQNIDYRNSYSSIPELGGGVHLDLIHEIDLCYWLFGMPSKVASIFRSKSSLQILSIDYSNYVLDYEHFCASIILNYYRRDLKRQIEILTENKTITLDLISGKVSDSNGNTLFDKKITYDEIYINQMTHFISCIKTQTKSINSFRESINVLKICLNDVK